MFYVLYGNDDNIQRGCTTHRIDIVASSVRIRSVFQRANDGLSGVMLCSHVIICDNYCSVEGTERAHT